MQGAREPRTGGTGRLNNAADGLRWTFWATGGVERHPLDIGKASQSSASISKACLSPWSNARVDSLSRGRSPARQRTKPPSAIIDMLALYRPLVHILTFDNGLEFARRAESPRAIERRVRRFRLVRADMGRAQTWAQPRPPAEAPLGVSPQQLPGPGRGDQRHGASLRAHGTRQQAAAGGLGLPVLWPRGARKRERGAQHPRG